MSKYTVHVIPTAWNEIKALPGQVRQRVRRAVDNLDREPRPPDSKELDVPEAGYELRRLRLGRWRIVYAISKGERWIDVLAVRKRPPYDYGDLRALLREV